MIGAVVRTETGADDRLEKINCLINAGLKWNRWFSSNSNSPGVVVKKIDPSNRTTLNGPSFYSLNSAFVLGAQNPGGPSEVVLRENFANRPIMVTLDDFMNTCAVVNSISTNAPKSTECFQSLAAKLQPAACSLQGGDSTARCIQIKSNECRNPYLAL